RHTRFSRDWSSDVCSSDLFFSSSLGSGARASEGRIQSWYSPVSSEKYAIHLLSGDHDGSRSATPSVRVRARVTPSFAGAVQISQIGRASCRERGWDTVATE